MIDAVLFHQPQTIFERGVRRGAHQLPRHDFRNAHPGGTLIFRGDFVGDVALRYHSQEYAVLVTHADGAHLFVAQIASRVMDRGFFGDEIDIAAGSDQVRNFHGILLAAGLERMVGRLKQRLQPKFSGRGSGERNTREHATGARTRIREFSFSAKNMENKSKQTALLLERRKILNGRRLSSNNIVALDYRRYSDGFTCIVVLLVHTNHTSVRADEDLGAACNFRRQSEREINFGAGSEVLLHHKVNAARRDIACLTVVRTRLSIDRQANVYR